MSPHICSNGSPGISLGLSRSDRTEKEESSFLEIITSPSTGTQASVTATFQGEPSLCPSAQQPVSWSQARRSKSQRQGRRALRSLLLE